MYICILSVSLVLHHSCGWFCFSFCFFCLHISINVQYCAYDAIPNSFVSHTQSLVHERNQSDIRNDFGNVEKTDSTIIHLKTVFGSTYFQFGKIAKEQQQLQRKKNNKTTTSNNSQWAANLDDERKSAKNCSARATTSTNNGSHSINKQTIIKKKASTKWNNPSNVYKWERIAIVMFWSVPICDACKNPRGATQINNS